MLHDSLQVAVTWKKKFLAETLPNQARSEVTILIAEVRSIAHFLLSHSFVTRNRAPTVAIWLVHFKT